MLDQATTASQPAGISSSGSGAEHVDVLIVGAGLSGIGAAHQLQAEFPDRSFAILESREALGGTWDLFRYPGIRSDSDMHTLGFRFRPWTEAKAIADGPSILRYLQQTARESGVDAKIRYGHRVVSAEWSSAEALWTVQATRTRPGTGEAETVRFTCWFLFCASGYYRYDEGYTPAFPGIERFDGQIVHPQHWPEDLDYAGKKIVVIGSGATAVTLVPALAHSAGHVTMLQRSPTYVVSRPAEDPLATRLRRRIGPRRTFAVVRWKNVLLQMASYQLSRRRPERMKALLRKALEEHLPGDFDIDTHFTPRYNPWDQRLCLVPDGDLFEALSEDRASIVTDEIETFTERGLRLCSGAELEADIVITATGLNLLFLGGMSLAVDGRPVDIPNTLAYKAVMLSGVPNFAYAVGYTNASWTLKVDLTYEYLWRLFRHLDAHGYRSCVPQANDATVSERPFLDLAAGYVLRSLDQLPKQGTHVPWRLRMNYLLDLVSLRFGRIDDGVLEFSRAPQPAPMPAAA